VIKTESKKKGQFLKSFRSIFSGMTLLDWILAAAFTILVALLVNSFFPPYGWMIGVPAALLLLFLAKRKRDHFLGESDKKE
jgi:uncharacterized membrane-anchored protein